MHQTKSASTAILPEDLKYNSKGFMSNQSSHLSAQTTAFVSADS